MAGEVSRHLEHVEVLPDPTERQTKPVRAHGEILMELAALLRLQSWHEGGLCPALHEEVPALVAALDDSEAKLALDPNAFGQEGELPPLAEKVFDVWAKHLAWSGLDELSADVVLELAPADAETMLHDLADLLWQHRHTAQEQPRS
jgi:hypothetical protein